MMESSVCQIPLLRAQGVYGTRLLLIDDNPKLCRMVKEYLEPLGLDGFEVLRRFNH